MMTRSIGIALTATALAALVGCQKPSQDTTTSATASAAAATSGAPNSEPSAEPKTPGDATSTATYELDLAAKRFGALTLGMSEDEAKKAEPGLEKGAIDTWLKSGPVEVRFDEGKVVAIRLELAKTEGIKVGNQLIPATATYEEAAKLFADCGDTQHNTGANVIECEKGNIVVLGAGVSQNVHVELHATE